MWRALARAPGRRTHRMQQQVAAPPRGRFELEHFAPAWGATVMGTSIISTFFAALSARELLPSVTRPLALVFLVAALGVAAAVIPTTAARLLRYRSAVAADLGHPVKGGMSATFPGGLLALAVSVERSGAALFGEAATHGIVVALAAVGAGLAIVFGLVFLSGLFARGTAELGMVTGAWFIPPVVVVIVPVALAPLLTQASRLGEETLAFLWVLTGVGTLLYLAVTAAVFLRSVTMPPPPAGLAPSLIIGMGPAGLIGADVLLLTEAGVRLGAADPGIAGAMIPIALAFWGFGIGWGVAAVFVIRQAYSSIPFGLASWGFTFPLGAWAVAGIVIGSAANSLLLIGLSILGGVILLALWVGFAWKTLAGMRSGSIWAA